MTDLLDRLTGDIGSESESRIPSHQFYAALVGLADGQISRAQIETLFDISPTGVDETQFNFIINGYTNAADKGRYFNALHSIFMLLEHSDFSLTKTQIQNWLTAAEAAY